MDSIVINNYEKSISFSISQRQLPRNKSSSSQSHTFCVLSFSLLSSVLIPTSQLCIYIYSQRSNFFTSSFSSAASMASLNNVVVFEDFFPTMVERLGTEGFMKELRNGFCLLMDKEKEVITFESLKKNSALLGMQGMSDDELMCMVIEGDMDGDGALDEMEFCTLMFRLSPDLMNNSKSLLEEAIFDEH